MASTHDLAALNAVGKELYDGQKIAEMFLFKNPALALIEKKTDTTGEVYPIPVIVSGPQGTSNTFANALANSHAAVTRRFNLTRGKVHGVQVIDRETMLAIRGSKGAFKDAVKLAVDAAVKSIRNTISVQFWGTGTGRLGQFASGGISTGVVTLADASTARRFDIGMKCTVGTTDGTVEAGTGAGFVIKVDEAAGTVTFAQTQGGSAANPTNWNAGSYPKHIMLDGCENAAIKGIPGWIPDAAVSLTDNWFGVNRSEHSRLAGILYDGTGVSVREALITLASKICAAGGDADPTHCFVNQSSYLALDNELAGKAEYQTLEGTAKLKFKGIKLPTENGEVTVLPDRSVPSLRAWMLSMNTWKLYSILDVPHVQNDEGLDMFTRDPNSDGYQVRFAAYCNPGCNAPGYNGVATLSA